MDLAPKSHSQGPRTAVTVVVVGWILIALKCTLLPSLFVRWQIPIHPGWVIIPTLIFASIVTVLVAVHSEERR